MDSHPGNTDAALAHAGRQPTHLFKDLRSASHAKKRTREHLYRYKHFRALHPIDLPSHPNQQGHIPWDVLCHGERLDAYRPHLRNYPLERFNKREAYLDAQCSYPWPRHYAEFDRYDETIRRKRKRTLKNEAAEPLSYDDECLVYDIPGWKHYRCCETCNGSTPEMNADGSVGVGGTLPLKQWKTLHEGFEERCLIRMAEFLLTKNDRSPSKVGLTAHPHLTQPSNPNDSARVDLTTAPKVSAETFLDSAELEYSDSWLKYTHLDEDNEEVDRSLYNEQESVVEQHAYYQYMLRAVRDTLRSRFWYSQPSHSPVFWSAPTIFALDPPWATRYITDPRNPVEVEKYRLFCGVLPFNHNFFADPLLWDDSDWAKSGSLPLIRDQMGCWRPGSWEDLNEPWCECEWCVGEGRWWDPEARVQKWELGAYIGDWKAKNKMSQKERRRARQRAAQQAQAVIDGFEVVDVCDKKERVDDGYVVVSNASAEHQPLKTQCVMS
ncbi:unnamed protein product [Periconia digitata]|uniref:Uncharacterized protein n=1 Tax=Periconia digitata TaxID=1303443 RepID=A0A9W4UT35_9PLEO|nr:unnamed protein product [Periconia digitata]